MNDYRGNENKNEQPQKSANPPQHAQPEAASDETDENGENGETGAMSDHELEVIVGGLTSVAVPICKHCQQRVAVYEMALCAACFRRLSS